MSPVGLDVLRIVDQVHAPDAASENAGKAISRCTKVPRPTRSPPANGAANTHNVLHPLLRPHRPEQPRPDGRGRAGHGDRVCAASWLSGEASAPTPKTSYARAGSHTEQLLIAHTDKAVLILTGSIQSSPLLYPDTRWTNNGYCAANRHANNETVWRLKWQGKDKTNRA